MKKVLLFAFTVFSMSGIAQHIGTMKPVEGFKPKADSKFEMAKRIDFSQLKPTMQTKDVTEPEGTKTSYFLDYYDYAYQIGPCMRTHVSSDIIIADDGKVYISNMFFTDERLGMFGDSLYITGKLNATKDSIIIDNNQLLGTINYDDGTECKYYICNLDTNSGDPLLSSNFRLAIDQESGIIFSDQNLYLGLYEKSGTTTQLYSFCTYMNYIPAEYYPQAQTYNYAFVDYNGEKHETTVDIINMVNYVYIRSLMPQYYPEAWVYGYFENGNIILPSYQIASDDIVFAFMTTSYQGLNYSTLSYNSDNQTYTSESGVYFTVLYYYPGDQSKPAGVYFGDTCSDMVITPTPTAINTVEAGNKVVASTEYYDLSGRRIVLDDTTKGMCIKVVKYTDGTSDAIKMMR